MKKFTICAVLAAAAMLSGAKAAQAGMSVHENFRKVLNLWYENLRSVLAVPSGRIGRAV